MLAFVKEKQFRIVVLPHHPSLPADGVDDSVHIFTGHTGDLYYARLSFFFIFKFIVHILPFL